MTKADRVWCADSVTSPGRERPVPVLVARDIPYATDGNRLQNLTIYLPLDGDAAGILGQPAVAIPKRETASTGPVHQVHVHGGAWRDPMLDARSIEAAVACAFDPQTDLHPISAIASLNYTLTQFPNHPGDPYDAEVDGHRDPAREAVHPRHVHDVYLGLSKLATMGLTDGSFVLTGHSAGSCLALQSCLMPPKFHGLRDVAEPPTPAAAICLNGLYDLPALVYGLGPSHEINAHDYRAMLSNAFGPDEASWAAASPARFDAALVAERLACGKAPRLVILDESVGDQLVPMNQRDRMASRLRDVGGLRTVLGERCTGKHAEPWQKGGMIWDSVLDALALLRT